MRRNDCDHDDMRVATFHFGDYIVRGMTCEDCKERFFSLGDLQQLPDEEYDDLIKEVKEIWQVEE